MQGDLINRKTLQRKLGGVSAMFISRRLRDDPTFPKPIRLGAKQCFWSLNEVDQWIESRRSAQGVVRGSAAAKMGACHA